MSVPESGQAFETMMREIDSELARDGIPIPARPIRAIMAVGSRFGIPIPIAVAPGVRAPADLKRYEPLSNSIKSWYETNYADRLKLDFTPGKMVLRIEEDLYLLRVPRIFGSAHFFVSRQLTRRNSNFTRGPTPCNVLTLIESLTAAKIASLSDDTLDEILERFMLGLEAHYLLEATASHRLIQSARSDVQTAINNLLDRSDRFGESKWASLQAAEKTIKAAIDLNGGKFSFSHNLAHLFQELEHSGIVLPAQPFIDEIQCQPGIRYGESTCTRQEAVDAHQSSLRLVCALKNAGAKFKSGLR